LVIVSSRDDERGRRQVRRPFSPPLKSVATAIGVLALHTINETAKMLGTVSPAMSHRVFIT
jgi:hypothetical protein